MGYANGIRVMSMTHTGEPGFMLYIPIEVRDVGTVELDELLGGDFGAAVVEERNSLHFSRVVQCEPRSTSKGHCFSYKYW